MSKSKFGRAVDIPETEIKDINISGLKGRMLILNKSEENNILLLYGNHASIERTYSFAKVFARDASVTLPDMPGFGGMDSLSKVGLKPSTDNLADYLASFVNFRYKNRKFTIVASSLGFVVATKMLQKYPEIASRVNIVVSYVGFTHHDDFKIGGPLMHFYKFFTYLNSVRVFNFIYRNTLLNQGLIRLIYPYLPTSKHKFKELGAENAKKAIDFEVILWKINDPLTHMRTLKEFFKLDLCKNGTVDLPVHHVTTKNDQYLDDYKTEQHMRIIFNNYKKYYIDLKNHAPSIIADESEAEKLVPVELLQVIKKAAK